MGGGEARLVIIRRAAECGVGWVRGGAGGGEGRAERLTTCLAGVKVECTTSTNHHVAVQARRPSSQRCGADARPDARHAKAGGYSQNSPTFSAPSPSARLAPYGRVSVRAGTRPRREQPAHAPLRAKCNGRQGCSGLSRAPTRARLGSLPV
jgi:hypothetical protein